MGASFYRAFTRFGSGSQGDGPYWGVTNPLHIRHCMGDEYLNANLPRDDYELVQNLLSDKKYRRATLMVDHIRLWPQALQSAGKALPAFG